MFDRVRPDYLEQQQWKKAVTTDTKKGCGAIPDQSEFAHIFILFDVDLPQVICN
jgi:hypothetical protein